MRNADDDIEFVYDKALGCWEHEGSKNLLGANEERDVDVSREESRSAEVREESRDEPVEERESEDAVVLKKLRRPEEPTQKEIEDHESCHIPYRSWCPSCVSGRGRSGSYYDDR